jgi:hypothetical protein
MFCLHRKASVHRSPGMLYKFTRMLHKSVAITSLHPVMSLRGFNSLVSHLLPLFL